MMLWRVSNMGYKDNRFNSSQGMEIVNEIFDLMFVTEGNDPNQLNKKDLKKQVQQYRGNIVNIVNRMRKFVTGYQQVPIAETNSSGVHVCPHCMRRDFIWNWEVTDGGHYSDPNNWNASVTPKTWPSRIVGEGNRHCFPLRYRCNHVTTCNKCKVTWRGHGKSTCPECNSSDVSKVGCLQESYAVHFVREYTMIDNFPQSFGDALGLPEKNRQIIIGRNKTVMGQFTGYELVIPSVPDGKVIETFQDIEKYTPHVKFTYSDKKTGKTKTRNYPVSELNYAISKQNLKVCKMGLMENGVYNHPGQPNYLRDYSGDPTSECSICGAKDPPTVDEIPSVYYRPRAMRITNPQPLDTEALTPYSFKGKPVYNIFLESTVNTDYKILLPLPMERTLNKIPDKPTPMMLRRGVLNCPNDVGGSVELEDRAEQVKEQLEEAMNKLTAKAQSEYGYGPADQQTSPGFTYLIAEGRSRKAYLDPLSLKWIDDSPDCVSYRGMDGSLLASPRTYARWNHIPRYADPNSSHKNYLGPNPQTNIIQDWVKSSNTLANVAEGGVSYHRINRIDVITDEMVGTSTEIWECLTCKGIVQKGSVLDYRVGKGMANPDGTAKGNFPQKVLDAEIAYENKYPKQNALGNPVPTAWGVTTGGQDGKEMLMNPVRRIRID